MVFGVSAYFCQWSLEWDVHTNHKKCFLIATDSYSTKTSLQLGCFQEARNQLISRLHFSNNSFQLLSAHWTAAHTCVCECVRGCVCVHTSLQVPVLPYTWFSEKWVCMIPIAGFLSSITYQHIPLPLKVMVITNDARKSNLGIDSLKRPLYLWTNMHFAHLPIIDLQGLWHVGFRQASFKNLWKFTTRTIHVYPPAN